MDFDDNDEIGPSGHDVQAEEEDLRESLAGLSRLASDRLPPVLALEVALSWRSSKGSN